MYRVRLTCGVCCVRNTQTLLELDQSRPDGALVHMSVKQDITDNSKVAASMSFFPEKMASSVRIHFRTHTNF